MLLHTATKSFLMFHSTYLADNVGKKTKTKKQNTSAAGFDSTVDVRA